jgi:alpha-beta hydrolase superfamily lysophospholipase
MAKNIERIKDAKTAKRKNKNIKSKVALGAVAGLGVVAFGVRAALQRLAIRLVTEPDRANNNETPTQYNLPFEEVWFNSRDDIRLHGWFIPANEAKATIILGHGHTSSKEPWLDIAQFLWQSGYAIFMFDFRGHGRSGDAGVSISYQERMDVHGAVDYLVGRGETRLGMYGFSMGAAIGIIATAENPHIKAMIADSSFAYLGSSVAVRIQLMQPWVPDWLARPLAAFTVRTVSNHFGYHHKLADPITFVGDIAPRPIFILHGELDDITPVSNAYQLYEAAHEPKELWIQMGLAHSCGFGELGDIYRERILEFLAKVQWETPAFVAGQFQPTYL